MTRRRYILITAAVVATGLVVNVTQVSRKTGQLHARLHCKANARRKLRSSSAHVRLPVPDLTPEQLERARSAMQAIHGDSGLLGRKL